MEREKISTNIREIIDKETDPWGIKVENVELKDISLTEEMKRVIARAAEAEREKVAVITKAKAGISHYTMNKLTKGENVTIDTLGKICKALDCAIEDIVEFIEN